MTCVLAMNELKDPPTLSKVATTLEKPPTPTHSFVRDSHVGYVLHNGKVMGLAGRNTELAQ